MTSKKGGKASGSLTALKMGSRVPCTDDGVQGRITWANSVSVKVQWDDGEHETWRRDSLAERPIEILQPADSDEHIATNPATTDAGQGDSVGVPGAEQSPIPTPPRLIRHNPSSRPPARQLPLRRRQRRSRYLRFPNRPKNKRSQHLPTPRRQRPSRRVGEIRLRPPRRRRSAPWTPPTGCWPKAVNR